MNKRMKVILLLALALVSVLLITSCGEEPPYERYDEEGFSVSVKYDANGGILTDGVSVIMDTYSISGLPEIDGMKVAQLIAPENVDVRGSVNKFHPTKNGYTFAGWYAERIEVTDDDGNVTYKYAKKWDFKKDRLRVDPNSSYNAQEPVMTLYAAWVPNVSFEFYFLDNPDVLIDTVGNIGAGGEIVAPSWNAGMGTMFMGDFPEIGKGKTFIAAYTDPEGKNKITGATVKHTGKLDEETTTVDNPVMKIYIEAWDGDWKYVYAPKDLTSNFKLDGNYVIMNDIDFLINAMPELGIYDYHSWLVSNVSAEFTGKIVGVLNENGEPVKIKNINFSQAQSSPPNYNGLFGVIGAGAVIENVKFENLTMTIDSGAPFAMSMSYGLLAGKIDDGAVFNNVSVSGAIKISSYCKFHANGRLEIGLISGSGNSHGIDYSNITCEKLDDRDGFEIEVENGRVYLTLPNA